MLARFLAVPLSERRSNGFMAISKRRFKVLCTLIQREVVYPKFPHSERKGLLH